MNRVPFGLFGELAAQRRRLGLSTTAFARRLGVDVQVYRRAANGDKVCAKAAAKLHRAALAAGRLA